MKTKKYEFIGLTEKITLIGNKDKSKTIIARIDTGAVLSSIDTNLAAELNLGPIIKTKKVKSANGISERPIIKCSFNIKNNIYKTPVTLADRKNLKYKALIGQNLLKKTKLYINPRKKSK
jgi:hypothetical protein